ncbi:MAG: indole-3-glycerol-phosphate synthase [Legionellales bacterium]|nr:indole-3-glycerol-phosphate synthase [Legionellales bacterium]
MLSEILDYKKHYVKNLPVIENLPLAQHSFITTFKRQSLAIIAEIKFKSPALGSLTSELNPLKILKNYQEAGVQGISVLTDERYFSGSFATLSTVRRHCDLPLLCKDFIIDERQIMQARLHGADACLLIVKALEFPRLQQLKNIIESYHMDAIIEVFNQEELAMALQLDARIIQINHRDLQTLEINFSKTPRLLELIPNDCYVIGASGITQPSDINRLPSRINAVLIGSALMQSDNPYMFIEAVRALR